MPLRRAASNLLSRMAFALEILEGPTPRARTYGAASRTVFQLEGDLAELRASGALDRVRGLGPSCLDVIDDVIAGREPAELFVNQGEQFISGLGIAMFNGVQNEGDLAHERCQSI